MERVKTGLAALLMISAISVYRKAVSPWLPHCCRFTPTCSEYAQEALRTHGVFMGGAMALWRVLRCNPFGSHGSDPVREK